MCSLISRNLKFALSLVCCLPIIAAPTAAAEPDFEKDVLPLFQKHCIRCHNESTKDGGLSLETKQSALKGGENVRVIVPGVAAESMLLDYVTGPEPEMPKKGTPLNEQEIATLRNWIKAGAVWPPELRIHEVQLTAKD
ncbi:MAG: c-type cytochrome domain-containing protein, partial [Gimesia chilikensis]